MAHGACDKCGNAYEECECATSEEEQKEREKYLERKKRLRPPGRGIELQYGRGWADYSSGESLRRIWGPKKGFGR